MSQKTFYFENQETRESQILNFKVSDTSKTVSLLELVKKIRNWQTKSFKIFSADKNQYILFGNSDNGKSTYSVSKQLLNLQMILVKYSTIKDIELKSSSSDQEEENKKERSRERNIIEVIQLVQKWRELHDNPSDGKKMTLQEAAMQVGISKKTLDDYYYQLRVGQKHDFDFQSHFEDKIGVLRAFLKTKEPDRKPDGRNAKHSKKLKIIQEFSKKLKITQDENLEKVQNNQQKQAPIIFKKQTEKIKQIDEISLASLEGFQLLNEDQSFWGSPFTPLEGENVVDMENNFYNQFAFTLQDPMDPYLPFTNLLNKKQSNFDENPL